MKRPGYISVAARRAIDRRNFLALSGSAAAAAAVLASCGGGDDDDDASNDAPTPDTRSLSTPSVAPKSGGTLQEASDVLTSDIDPHASPTPTMFVSGRVFNSLLEMRMKPDLTGFDIKPALAEIPEQPDELTYTFKLVPNIKTHNKAPLNGRALTAEDAVANMQLIAAAPKEVASRFIRAFNFEGYDSITAIDETTAQIKFKTPFAPFLTYIADPFNVIIPKPILDQYGPIVSDSAGLVGTGPFMLESYTPKIKSKVVRNPDYFRRPAYFDAVETTIIEDPSTRIASLRSGAIDWLSGFNKEQADALKGTNPDLKSATLAQLSGAVWMFNTAMAPVSDPKVREAIDLALDREDLVTLLLGGDGQVTGAPIPPGLGAFSWNRDEIKTRYARNTAKAKELLSAAGFGNGVSIPFMGPTNYAQQCTAMKAQLEEVGIKLEPFDLIEYAAFTDRRIKKDYTTSFFIRAQYADPEEFMYKDLHSPPSSRNYYNYANPALDALLEKQRQEFDQAKRAQLMHDAQAIVMDDRPILSLYVANSQFMWQKKLEGFLPANIRSAYHTSDDWWFNA
ncbi:MAG: ABC transporter substrate-binding protein [Dehalococcoidia bacterium]